MTESEVAETVQRSDLSAFFWPYGPARSVVNHKLTLQIPQINADSNFLLLPQNRRTAFAIAPHWTPNHSLGGWDCQRIEFDA